LHVNTCILASPACIFERAPARNGVSGMWLPFNPFSQIGALEFGFITHTLNDGRTFRLGLTFGW